MNALLTDLYQLTMAAGYFESGKAEEVATFEMFVRRLPVNRNFLVIAGLEQVVDYLLHFRFSAEEVAYLRVLPQFSRCSPDFFRFLQELRFTGDLFAVKEGTLLYPGEPALVVRAPIVEAQIPETFLLSTVAFQTLIATKAARVVEAAQGRGVVEFGTRRAHSPEAGVLAGRAAYVGGCIGTSNTLSGMRYGIPVYGTAAHSWVQSFPDELEAFRALQQLLGEHTVYLIDTYDTAEGARRAASLGRPLWGVRIDSGNLVEVSRQVRQILDEAGLPDAKIMATSDLSEYKILELLAAKAPIDAFGVGTELATSADAPSLSAVYKIVEVGAGEQRRYTAKFSEGKATLPGAKQVFRYRDHDVLGCAWECPDGDYEPLLRPVLVQGERVAPAEPLPAARQRALDGVARLPGSLRTQFEAKEPWPVIPSDALRRLEREVRRGLGAS